MYRFVVSRRNGYVLVSLAAALLLHAGISVLFPTAGWTTSVGIGACNAVALAFCLLEARTADPDTQWRWRLLACTFLLWIMAFAASASLQSVLHADMNEAQADSLLFMLRGAPILLLVARTGEADRSAPIRRIDLGQAALFIMLVASLLFPRLISSGPTIPVVTEAQSLRYHEIQNYVLAGCALLGFFGQTRPAPQRFAFLLAWLLSSYALVASFVNHCIIIRLDPSPGSPILMLADIPQASFLLLAVVGPAFQSAPTLAVKRRTTMIRLVQPVLFSTGLLMLAFAVARVNFAAGFVGGIVALGLSAARSTVLQNMLLVAQRDLARAHHRLEQLAGLDPLTALPNRRLLDEKLASEWKRAARMHDMLALLLIDVDEFKSFNDTAGHLAGDECLRGIATVLAGSVNREGDLLTRYGGEEFVVIAPMTTLAAASALGEILRKAVADRAFPHPSNAGGIVTVSIGAAAVRAGPDISAEELFRQADAALYRAKSLGRNCVQAFGPITEPAAPPAL